MAGYDKSSALLLFLMMFAEAEAVEHQLEDQEEEDQEEGHGDIADEVVPPDGRIVDTSTDEEGGPSEYCTGIDLVPSARSKQPPIHKKPRLSLKEYAVSHKMISKRRTLDRSSDRFDKQVLMNGVQGTTGKESTTMVIGSSVDHKKYEQADRDEVN